MPFVTGDEGDLFRTFIYTSKYVEELLAVIDVEILVTLIEDGAILQ